MVTESSVGVAFYDRWACDNGLSVKYFNISTCSTLLNFNVFFFFFFFKLMLVCLPSTCHKRVCRFYSHRHISISLVLIILFTHNLKEKWLFFSYCFSVKTKFVTKLSRLIGHRLSQQFKLHSLLLVVLLILQKYSFSKTKLTCFR